MRRHGDFDAAEDAVQEALLAASVHWPRDGVPESPRGWLLQTAERRLIDQWRSDRSRRDREGLALQQETPPVDVPDRDDALILLFMCCHPSLTPASAIALTLRAVGGLTTAEIASAFLVGEPTMAQRISRAKERIKASEVPFRLPTRDERPARLREVLHVLYLIFNEGYTSSSGRDLQRTELSDEAIRLTRMVQRLVPDDAEVAGLLALMLLVDARRPARTDADGELVPLAEQDRALWDRALIAEGTGPRRSRSRQGGGRRVPAPGCDRGRPRPGSARRGHRLGTDPRSLRAARADDRQPRRQPQPGRRCGDGGRTLRGLAVLDSVDARMAGHYRLDAVRAHLLELAGDREGALAHYRAAAARTTSLPEQRHLAKQAARLRSADG